MSATLPNNFFREGGAREFITIRLNEFRTSRSRLWQVATAIRRNRQQINLAIAQAIAYITRSNFGLNGLHRPTPWPPYARSYSATKRKGSPATLIETGTLMNSVRASANTQVGVVTVEGRRNYAAAHQFGSRFLPARPFFPIYNVGGTVHLEQSTQRLVQGVFEFQVRKILGER